MGDSSGGTGTSALFSIVRFEDSATVSRGRGKRVMGTSTAGETGSQTLLPLLPSYLWLWAPLQPGGQSCIHCLPCRYWVFWDCRFSCHGWWTRIAGTTSTVPQVPPPLCVLVHPPLGVQICGILQCPGVLGRGTFVESWMFY